MPVTESVAPISAPPSPPTHASYLARRYFGSLDLFRFLSIAAVIWYHTSEGVAWFPASTRGFLGVDCFFVISGFLIVTLLLRERDRSGTISLRQFYLRRSLRIFPVYYAMLGTLAAFFLFVKPRSPMARPFLVDLPYQLAYLSDLVGGGSILSFTWSLAAEEQFYLAWPPVEKWLGKAAIPILLVVIAINQALNFELIGGAVGAFWRARSIGQITFTPICLGVLLAHALHDRRWYDRCARWLGRPWQSLALAALVILACNIPQADMSGWLRLTIQALMALLLATCVICEDNWLNRLLGSRAVRRIGVISYGMYLYHMFAAHVARWIVGPESSAPPFTFFLVTLTLTVAAAELSFRFYETPFLRLKDRLGGHARARREPETGGLRPR